MAKKNRKRKGGRSRYRMDSGWENVRTGAGTGRDKSTYTSIKAVPTSQTRQLFEDLYSGDDVAAKAVDAVVKEMLRAGYTVNVVGDMAEESAAVNDGVKSFLVAMGAKAVLRQGLTWGSVFGGGLVYLNIDDGQTDLAEPLRFEQIQSFTSMQAFDRWDVHIHTRYDTLGDTKLGEASVYRMNDGLIPSLTGALTGQLVHESRFLRFDGVLTTRTRRQANGGWSDSAYVRLHELLASYGGSWAGASNALHDFAQAVFKMQGLSESFSNDDGDLAVERLKQMDLCRSTMRMIPLDAEGESFERVATPLQGIPDLLDRLMLRVASAFNMPVSILMGQSPTGLSNTAEGDIKIWSREIEGQQEDRLAAQVRYLTRVVLNTKDGPTGGTEPEAWSTVFNPLVQLDSLQLADLRKKQSETDTAYMEFGVTTPEEIRLSRFGGEQYSSETTIDLAADVSASGHDDDDDE